MSSTPLHRLREMILSGELAPGERVTETSLADRLGVSRTPIRTILPVLATEGYLEQVGKRGYAVKQFASDEYLNALELRAALEGFAAKKLTTEGASNKVLADLELCLLQGDEIFKKRYVTKEDEDLYGEMNARFHDIIVKNCGLPLLIDFIDRLNKMPFVNPSVVVFDQVGLERAYEMLFFAHGEHHSLIEAIRDGDGARAEIIFREHGNAQRRSLLSGANPRNIMHQTKKQK